METLPFELTIRDDRSPTETAVIRCTGLLRELAGKRRVYDGHWNGREVIVKVFDGRVRGWRGRRREIQGLTALEQRGIPAPRILLTGCDRDGGRVLVVEKIAGGRDLADFFEACREDREKKAMYGQWIDFLAGMHEKGIVQADLHAGNFMTADGGLYALDPGTMRLGRGPADMKTGLRQLAGIVCSMPFADRREPGPFLERYARARGRSCGPEDLAELEWNIRMTWAQSVERTLKKTQRDSKRYFSLREGELKGMFGRRDWTEESARNFLRQMDRRMEEGQILKRGNTCFVSRVRMAGMDAVVKRYNHKGFVHSLRVTLKGSRARKCWLAGHRLMQLGIFCARPLAFVEQRKGGLVWQSYLASEFLEGPLLHQVADRPAAVKQAEQLLEQMKQFRLTHADMKPANLLSRDGRVALIDLDSLRRHRAEFYFQYRYRKMVGFFHQRLADKQGTPYQPAT